MKDSRSVQEILADKVNDSQELRKLLSIEVRDDDIQEIFKNKRIEELYNNVRNSEFVVQYYNNAKEQIKQQSIKRFPRVGELLEDKEVLEDSEKIIKTKLINEALNILCNKKIRDLDTAIILTITEENLLKIIDELEEFLDEKIQYLYNRIAQDVIFRVGLKFLD